MTDMSLPPSVNSAEVAIVLNLAAYQAVWDLSAATFRLRAFDAPGGIMRYEWMTGGSTAFPLASLDYDATSGALVARAPSADVARCFPSALVAARGGSFCWEAQFALAGEPDNWREIGDGPGAFPFIAGASF